MTNLTSEQYRSVLKHVPNVTEEIPNVLKLLRSAVQTFYKRFRGYPELAGVAPGKIGLFGDQLQFDEGVGMHLATPMATIVVGRRSAGKRYCVATASDVGKPHKVSFSFSPKRPLGPGCPKWLNPIKGVIDAYEDEVPPFEAVFETGVLKSDCFGKNQSLELAFYTFLEVLVGKKAKPLEKVKALEMAAEKFGSKKIGLIDRLTPIVAKDREIIIFDCRSNDILWVPIRNPDVQLVAVDVHLKNTHSPFPDLNKYLAKICELLGTESLRDFDDTEMEQFESKLQESVEAKLNEKEQTEEREGEEEEMVRQSEVWTEEEYEIMKRRGRYFLTELRLVQDAILVWTEGDLKAFGEKMNQSHESFRENCDFDHPVFNFLVNVSLEVEGVLGCKVTGSGSDLCIVSLVHTDRVQEYCNHLLEQFQFNKEQLAEELKEDLQIQKIKEYTNEKMLRENLLNSGSPDKNKESLKSDRDSKDQNENCFQKRKIPCILNEEKIGRCGTWAHFEELPQKEDFSRKSTLRSGMTEGSAEEEEHDGEMSRPSVVSEVPTPVLQNPTFYILSPFPGTRMMMVTKADLLRSPYAVRVPHPKDLVKEAVKVFKETYDREVESISLAPASTILFGDFLQYHLGYLICLALPMQVAMVGSRNESVFFSVKTTLPELKRKSTMRHPVPSVQSPEVEPRSWVNHILCTVNDFKDRVPGFDAVVHSSVPIKVGLNSRAAFHSCIYAFLESLTRHCEEDAFERIEKCHKGDMEADPEGLELLDACSSIKYFPTFLCKEGHLTCIDCKKSEISQHFFDDPAYVFLIACCKKVIPLVTLETLEDRLRSCMEAIDTLGRVSLLNLDMKHLKCLEKRGAPEEVVKRARYVITEHQRTTEALRAIQEQDYARVGLLMTQSHVSLRDDYQISNPQIDELFKLAMNAEGVLGAKMIGKGLTSSLIILIKLEDVDNCIRYMKRNYSDKTDKPTFYITKPSQGVYTMNPKVPGTVRLPSNFLLGSKYLDFLSQRIISRYYVKEKPSFKPCHSSFHLPLTRFCYLTRKKAF